MLFTSQQANEPEYEEITLTIGQSVRYYDNNNSISEGIVHAVDTVSELVHILTGGIIQYIDKVDYNDLIEG